MKVKCFVLLLFLGAIQHVFAQRQMIETTDEVAVLAAEDLDRLLEDEKFIKKLEKEKVKGDYTFDITVDEKGRISSMRAVKRSEDASIDGQNFLNDLVRKHKFKFKIPKGNSHRFTYTFEIN